nr:ORF2 [Mamastrovirus 3]
MANRQQKRSPRTTTNIVVRNGTAANQARASGPAAGNRRRRNRARRQAQINVRVLPSQNQGRRRFPRRQGVGSRIVFQKINSTLGTVGSNGSEQIECELTCLMNPATMKEATGSNSFTPLGIYASTYSLFRMTKCTLVLKPLVGDSAVSGTVIRASWNPTSTPTQTSWSALGARKHVDVTPGKTGRFTLTSRDLVGPKGGWFKTNTKGDPMMSFAGTLEIHTLGKTISTYRNTDFTGGLFLAELETQWQFKDYSQQPGMLNLIKGEDTQQSHIRTDENGKIQLVVPTGTRMAKAATGASSEIIWLVTDTVIQAGTAILPPPFGWLIRGGWWLVKKAAGVNVRNGETVFDVYASISDARADMPCISTSNNMDPIQIGGLHFQQVTPGNTGIATGIPAARYIICAINNTKPDLCCGWDTAALPRHSGGIETSTGQMDQLLKHPSVPGRSWVCCWHRALGHPQPDGSYRLFFGWLPTVCAQDTSVPHVQPVQGIGWLCRCSFLGSEPTNPYALSFQHSISSNRKPAVLLHQGLECHSRYLPQGHSLRQLRGRCLRHGWHPEWNHADQGCFWEVVCNAVCDGGYHRPRSGCRGDLNRIRRSVGVAHRAHHFHTWSTQCLNRSHTKLCCWSHVNTSTVINPSCKYHICLGKTHLTRPGSLLWLGLCSLGALFQEEMRRMSLKQATSMILILTQMKIKILRWAQMITIPTHQYPGWWFVMMRSRCMNNSVRRILNGQPAWQEISCFQAMSTPNSPRCTMTRLLMAYHLRRLGRKLWVSRMALASCKILIIFQFHL